MPVILINPAGSRRRKKGAAKMARRKTRRRKTTRRRKNPTHRRRRTTTRRRRRTTARRRPTRARRRRNPAPRRRRRRNPRFGAHRPRLRYTSRGWKAGKRSKSFRRKRTIVKRNPKFNVRRVISAKVWVDGLKDATAILAGVAAQNVIAQQVTARVTDALGLDDNSSKWVSRFVSVVNAAFVGELARVFLPNRRNVANLVFAGALFSTVKGIATEFLPPEVSGYLGTYGWPGDPRMYGYATVGTPVQAPPSSMQSLRGFLAVGDRDESLMGVV